MPHPSQPLASLQQVLVTPSRQDGVPEDLEDDLRVMGCVLIQELGVMLELPQSTLATAHVLLQRFFYVSSLSSYTVNDIAIGSLYLSFKLTESQLRLRDLLNVYLLYIARNEHLRTRLQTRTRNRDQGRALEKTEHQTQAIEDELDPLEGFEYTPPSFHSPVYYELKDVVVVAEMQILKRLGFHVQVDLPYSHMINYCKILDLVIKPGVVQLCWSILNDALQTPIYAHYPPPTLACFSILLATRLLAIPLPDRWWVLFDADYDDMWTACGWVMRLWRDWGDGNSSRPGMAAETETETLTETKKETTGDQDTVRQARWARACGLATSRKYVRKYIERVELEDEKRAQ